VCVHTLYTHTHTYNSGRTDWRGSWTDTFEGNSAGAHPLDLNFILKRYLFHTHTHERTSTHTKCEKGKEKSSVISHERATGDRVTEHKRRQKKRMRRKSVCVCAGAWIRFWAPLPNDDPFRRNLQKGGETPSHLTVVSYFYSILYTHTHRDIYVCVCEQASKLSHSTHTHSRLVCSGCVTFLPLGNRFFAKKKWPGGATSYQKLAPVLSLPFPSADILRSEKTQLVLGSFSAYCATHEMAIADLKWQDSVLCVSQLLSVFFMGPAKTFRRRYSAGKYNP
jgi:hypothetical protein